MTNYAAFLESKRIRLARSVYIYALIDPCDGEIRYVGKSIRPRQRLQNHCNEPAGTWRTNWLQSLKRRGRRPQLRILQVLDRDDDWQQAERRWIADLKAEGVRLTNCTAGGDGVVGLPSEIRARMRMVWLGRKHKPETLEKLRGRTFKHTDEHRAKMRRVMAGRRITWGDKLRLALSKLTESQVREIRRDLACGVIQTVLADRYGVNKGTISNIKRGKCYQWVTP